MAAASLSSTRPLLLLKLQPSHRLHNSHLVFPSKLNPSLLRSSTSRSRPRSAVIASAQSNFFKVIQTAFKIGKEGIDAGTDLVPDLVPRPVARISVAVVAVTVGLFLLKSVISTAFFVLAMMGFIYFVYITLNKDEGPKGGGGDGGGSQTGSSGTDEEALDEVRRIMEKYK